MAFSTRQADSATHTDLHLSWLGLTHKTCSVCHGTRLDVFSEGPAEAMGKGGTEMGSSPWYGEDTNRKKHGVKFCHPAGIRQTDIELLLNQNRAATILEVRSTGNWETIRPEALKGVLNRISEDSDNCETTDQDRSRWLYVAILIAE